MGRTRKPTDERVLYLSISLSPRRFAEINELCDVTGLSRSAVIGVLVDGAFDRLGFVGVKNLVRQTLVDAKVHGAVTAGA